MDRYDLSKFFELKNEVKILKVASIITITILIVIITILSFYIRHQNKCINEYRDLTSIILREDK